MCTNFQSICVFHLNISLVWMTSVHKWFGLAGINSNAPSKRASTPLALALIWMIKACVTVLQLGRWMTCGHCMRWLLYAGCITRPCRGSAEITRHQYRFFHHTILGCPLCIMYQLCVFVCVGVNVPVLSCLMAFMHVDLHFDRLKHNVGYCIPHGVRWKSHLHIWWFLCFQVSWRITWLLCCLRKWFDLPGLKHPLKALLDKIKNCIAIEINTLLFCSVCEMQGFHLTTGLFLFVQVQYNMRNSNKQSSTNG